MIRTLGILILFLAQVVCAQQGNLSAGFRASRILGSFPGRQFPAASYWVQTGKQIASRFAGSTPAAIWIVSLYQDSDETQLNFPSPGGTFPFIRFISVDQNEAYLSQFDAEGFRVWLQVEPGPASVDTLIDLVLSRYKHHPCVAGIGIDVEWLNAKTFSGGRKLTDSAEVGRWERKVKSFNPSYTLFLKHYSQSWMPSVYRGEILFVDDSQQFTGGLTQMVNEFKSWGAKFAPNKVAFQFGYPKDSTWWQQYPDPFSSIGSALVAGIPNAAGLFWVDFTIVKLFPVTSIPEIGSHAGLKFTLEQNYPNPFSAGGGSLPAGRHGAYGGNPSTAISYQLPAPSARQTASGLGVEGSAVSHVRLDVFDALGREVATLVNDLQPAGSHTVRWDGSSSPSGIYFYRLWTGGHSVTKRMILIR